MINRVYNCDWFKKAIIKPDRFYDFIFIDPPYFKVKGEFDFKLTFSEWIELHKKLAKECYRILKNNGSIILWGHAKKIAYQQIEFDKYFKLLNSCVWEKKQCRTKKIKPEDARSFLPITERFLFYDKGEDKSGLTMIFSNPDLFKSIKEYMRTERKKAKKAGFDTKKITVNILGLSEKSKLYGHFTDNSQWLLPTKVIYQKLQTTGFFKREYEDLRREYEDLRRYFKLTEKIKYDVIKWDQEVNKTKENNHPTCKPPGLVTQLVKICCGKNAKIFEPFTGTETLRKIAWNMGFYYEGCEIDPDYWQAQENRFQTHINQPEIFGKQEIQKHIFTQEKLL